MINYKGKDRSLIVVSNRLPYYKKSNKSGGFTWAKAAGGLITALEPIIKSDGGSWIGWDGHPSKESDNQEITIIDAKEIDSRQSDGSSYKIGCVPLSDEEVDLYYTRFSNGTLWSLFHYFFEKCTIDYDAWNIYRNVNQRFAAAIDKIAADDALIWIQDYQLFLVPLYLRKLRPNQEIHFFLHIPFPHNDIFSILPWGDKILESLMACQSVGFHHEQYLKNFKEAVEHYEKKKSGRSDSRFFVNPISVDFTLIDKTSRMESVIKRKDEIREHAGCSKLIIGVDRIDYSKGIKERLLAVEQFLIDYPELRGEFYYYQLVIPSREAVESYRSLKKEVDEIVGRINGTFSTETWIPIHYSYGTVPFEELISLYLASDIALVTPLRDGMNLVCKEYVAARSDEDGVLILSEFAGASAELTESLLVNPYSIKDIKEALHTALQMPESERKKRIKKMRAKVKKHDIETWLRICLSQ